MSSFNMSEQLNLKKYAILYVDDEANSLKWFKKSFDYKFNILLADDAHEGLKLFNDHKNTIGLLITDQRMPGIKGVQLLEQIRKDRPNIVRILVTAYSDFSAAIDAVNKGSIYKYVSKPWDIEILKRILIDGLTLFNGRVNRKNLMQEKITLLHKKIVADKVINSGKLASSLGHYVHNAMTGVRIFLDLIPVKLKTENLEVESLQDTEYWNNFYDCVQSHVDRITRMLTDLNDVSKYPDRPFNDNIDINKIIKETITDNEIEFGKKRIVITTNFTESLPTMLCDKLKIKQLFNLLIKDELVTLPGDNEINIKTNLLKNEHNDPAIEITLTDDGPGLSEKCLSSVFDPFVNRNNNPQEFGLNLTACYFIVYHHCGKISLNHEPDLGTSFLISLPCNPKYISIDENDKEICTKAYINNSLIEDVLTST